MSKKDYMYTEEVIIPSKGLLNPDIPEGKITLRCIELRDQKFLSGSKNIYTNKAVALLERCIIEPENINVKNLTQVDLFFLLVKLRILSYGNKYSYIAKCPICKKFTKITCNLSEVKSIELDEKFEDNLHIVLPRRGDTVYTHIQTQRDSEEIDNEVKRLKSKFEDMVEDPSVTLSIAKLISKIDLKEPNKVGLKTLDNPVDILQYVESLTDLDALAIQSTVDSIYFGIEPVINTTCEHCGENISVLLQTTPEFFRPKYVS